jgi:hypothetical protein
MLRPLTSRRHCDNLRLGVVTARAHSARRVPKQKSESVSEPGRLTRLFSLPRSFQLLMTRLHFLLTGIAGSLFCPTALWRLGSGYTFQLKTWAMVLSENTKLTGRQRFEHYLHANYCAGSRDRGSSPQAIAARKTRCAKVCGLCRYLNSLKEWPQSNYRRPPQAFLDELEAQPWCLTWRAEAPYDPSKQTAT